MRQPILFSTPIWMFPEQLPKEISVENSQKTVAVENEPEKPKDPEMDLLKQPWSADLPDAMCGIAQKMCFAVRGSDIFVTPMAAVAGAVAEEILEAMLYEAKNHDLCLEEIQRMYVNNGGDIAFWLNAGESFSIGVVAQQDDN